jgi:hypothetical protein
MNRRNAIKLGATLGVTAGVGLYSGYRFLPPSPSRTLEPVDVLARRLYVSLDDAQRAETCVSYDHPLRQYHNRGVWGGGREILFGFNRAQRQILTDLFYAGLSVEGRDRVPHEDLTNWTGVHSMRALICGDPTTSTYQIILTGVHLNLRIGGKSREGAAFGGPQVYGDQGGNGREGLPGNVYREQFLFAQRILHRLDPGQIKLALIEEAPVQTKIELQGRRGSFRGIPVYELVSDAQELTRELVRRILATYPPNDAAYADKCIGENGGIDSLFLSYYQHGQDGDIFDGQVFRLEGPAAVFYFRGYPHVHAFINIAMDGDAPLSVGEPLGNNPSWLDHGGVKTLFETAMRSETKADLAYYDENSVAGRLRPGVVRSGDIYSLESWQEGVDVVEIRGSELSSALRNALKERRLDPHPDKRYTVATTAYVAREDQKKIGNVTSRRSGPMLRDLTIQYLRSHGFTELNS